MKDHLGPVSAASMNVAVLFVVAVAFGTIVASAVILFRRCVRIKHPRGRALKLVRLRRVI
jgi:hypothetical protein